MKEAVDTTSYHNQSNGELLGVQNAVRNQSEQLTQALQLLGQVKQELIVEQSKVKTLQVQMENVYTYINERKVR